MYEYIMSGCTRDFFKHFKMQILINEYIYPISHFSVQFISRLRQRAVAVTEAGSEPPTLAADPL